MEFKPVREIESNAVVRWMANRALSLGCWLIKVAAPYTVMYTATIDEDDIPQE